MKTISIYNYTYRKGMYSVMLSGLILKKDNDTDAKRYMLLESMLLVEAHESIVSMQGGIIVFPVGVQCRVACADEVIYRELCWKRVISAGMKEVTENIQKLSPSANGVASDYNFSVGNFFKGHFKSASGQSFEEPSTCIEILGIDSNFLLKLAEELAIKLKQPTLLVKDYQTTEILVLVLSL